MLLPIYKGSDALGSADIALYYDTETNQFIFYGEGEQVGTIGGSTGGSGGGGVVIPDYYGEARDYTTGTAIYGVASWPALADVSYYSLFAPASLTSDTGYQMANGATFSKVYVPINTGNVGADQTFTVEVFNASSTTYVENFAGHAAADIVTTINGWTPDASGTADGSTLLDIGTTGGTYSYVLVNLDTPITYDQTKPVIVHTRLQNSGTPVEVDSAAIGGANIEIYTDGTPTTSGGLLGILFKT